MYVCEVNGEVLFSFLLDFYTFIAFFFYFLLYHSFISSPRLLRDGEPVSERAVTREQFVL